MIYMRRTNKAFRILFVKHIHGQRDRILSCLLGETKKILLRIIGHCLGAHDGGAANSIHLVHSERARAYRASRPARPAPSHRARRGLRDAGAMAARASSRASADAMATTTV
jgi:hypothetical protein